MVRTPGTGRIPERTATTRTPKRRRASYLTTSTVGTSEDRPLSCTGLATLCVRSRACPEGDLVTDRLIPLQVDGVELLVEATPVAGSEPTSARLDRAQGAVVDAFDRAQSAIVAVAASTVDTIGRLGERSVHPDEMTVTFGLKFSAQGHVIVAGASGEAALEVSLTYRRNLGHQPAQGNGRGEAAGLIPGDGT